MDTASLGALAYGIDGDIYVADWDGAYPVRIADGRPPSDCHDIGEYWGEGPIWSPDGKYLAFRHTDCDAAPRDVWWDVVISDPQGNVVTSFPSEGWLISWSPDSTRVATWVRWGETIGVYGLDGERRQALTMPPAWKLESDVDPVWSPDGRSLFVPEGAVVPIDGSKPQLTNRHLGYWFAFSPDGSRVAYPARTGLVVAEADGSNPREVFDPEVPGGLVSTPVWSPTGDRIAFSWMAHNSVDAAADDSLGPSSHVGVVDVATGTVTMLAQAEGKDFVRAIDLSRDGDQILFARLEDEPALTSLWSVNADGSDPRRLVTGTNWGDWQSLSPTR